jgi:hypothetical protein
MYGQFDAEDACMLTICRQLQRAAYLGTLLAAAAMGKERAVLTLIGGGVFANPLRLVWDSILWAAEQAGQVLHRNLTVIVNGRNLAGQLAPSELAAAARARGGALIRLGRGGTTIDAE